MTKLIVYTGHHSYIGSDRLDISRKTGDPHFAPSWKLLTPQLDLRRAGRETDETWRSYAAAYVEEIRAASKTPEGQRAWKALLAREVVTLTCYCLPGERCHRHLMAAVLWKLGATLGGDRDIQRCRREIERLKQQNAQLQAENFRLSRAAYIRSASSPARPHIDLSARDRKLLALAMSPSTTVHERESALSALSAAASDALRDLALAR